MTDTTLPTKSFWSRPEGKTGLLFIAAALFGLWFAGPTILGLLTMGVFIMGKALALGLYTAATVALFLILTNRQFITICWYGFRMICRALTGMMIQIDPIGIMRSYITELKTKLVTINDGISKLNGETEKLQSLIGANEEEAAKSLQIAQAAVRAGRNAAVPSRQAERLRESNQTLQKVLNTMQLNYRTLQKWRDITRTAIEDIQNEVDVKERQRTAIRTSYSVMMTIRSIINGDPNEKEMFERSMQAVADDYGEKLGAINDFIESSRSIVDSFDSQNEAYAEKAAHDLSDWDQRADSLLLLPKPDSASALPQTNAASRDGMSRFLQH